MRTGSPVYDTQLPSQADAPGCPFELPAHDYSQLGALRSLGEGFFVTAQIPGDMSFVHSSWEQGIESWRFKLPAEPGTGPIRAHTIFDRSLLRAGETVHMKHLVRKPTLGGFALPSLEQLPDTVSVRHSGSSHSYEFPLAWDSSGVAETEWSIPKDAKLGSYTVILRRKSGPELASPLTNETGDEEIGEESTDGAVFQGLTAGRFRVEEFRVPLLKGIIQPPVKALVDVGEVTLDLSVQYLAGGGASFLPVKLRAGADLKRIEAFEGFDDFIFGNGAVREGLARRGEPEDRGEGLAEGERLSKRMVVDVALDSSGAARTVVPGLPRADMPRASGIGRELKLEQRRVALAMGLELMEWTFEPLVAVNAHLNLRRLGVVVEEYALNVYGESVSPLHRGAPTDRFIAQWWMRSSRVQALLGGAALRAGADAVLDAPRLNEVERQGEWLACVDYDLGRVEPSLGVTIPARFTEMLSRQPEEARAWRMVSRAIFHTYLGRGYRVTDFSFEPGADRGTYLLEAGPVGTDPSTRPLA